MGHVLMHYEGQFLVWSTVCDAPITFGMSLEELREFSKDMYGSHGLDQFDERVQRTIQNGTSFHDGTSFDELISGNRAGFDESSLTKGQFIKFYFEDKPGEDVEPPVGLADWEESENEDTRG